MQISLLVKGDIILLCPGHTAPAHCQSLPHNFESASEQNLSSSLNNTSSKNN